MIFNGIKGRKIVICFLAILCLVSCNDASTPTEAIESFNSEMNNCDYKGAFEYVSSFDGLSFDSGNSSGTKSIVNAVSKTLEIEILDIQTSGAVGLAQVSITTVDLREIYSSAIEIVTNSFVDSVLSGSKISADDMKDALMEEIVSEAAEIDAPKVTTECNINMTREDDKWYLILDTECFNIMMGYLDDANEMITSGDFTISVISDSDLSDDSGSDDSSEDDESESEVTYND